MPVLETRRRLRLLVPLAVFGVLGLASGAACDGGRAAQQACADLMPAPPSAPGTG